MAWEYTPGALQLSRNGSAPEIADNTTDIAGLPRPSSGGYYAIGCHEPVYDIIGGGIPVYHKMIIDSGAVYMNFVDMNNPGTLLGATRQGSTFSIEQDVRDMQIDGAKGKVKGSRRFAKANIKLTVNFIDHTKDLWKIAIPGAEYSSGEMTRSLEITDESYIDNVVIIAEMMNRNIPVVCGVKNALADGAFEIGTQDSEETGLVVQFTGHYDTNRLDGEPFILFYPEEEA